MPNIPAPDWRRSPFVSLRGIRGRRGRRRMAREISEILFRGAGAAMTGIALLLLVAVLFTILQQGLVGLSVTQFALDVPFERDRFGLAPGEGALSAAESKKVNWRRGFLATMRERFPDANKDRRMRRMVGRLAIPRAESLLASAAQATPGIWKKTMRIWVPFSQEIDLNHRIGRAVSERKSQLVSWYAQLKAAGQVRVRFDWGFLTRDNARHAERAGIWGALAGTMWLFLVTMALSLPIGVAAAIYLEEIAPRNWLSLAIELNVNNLAAVPSIVFGLLGLAVFLDLFGMRRSIPLVGGMTLAMMTLPVIIISTRSALRSVSFSVREAALALGASRMRCVFDHVLPLAAPGIITGAIIGLARAIGETAPLIMIGMVAFVIDAPGSPLEPAAALPVQIFLWADQPEPLFRYRAGAAILVLVVILIILNLLARAIRLRFERNRL